jgi:hypothetical protein
MASSIKILSAFSSAMEAGNSFLHLHGSTVAPSALACFFQTLVFVHDQYTVHIAGVYYIFLLLGEDICYTYSILFDQIPTITFVVT